jgi:hypothetical protein
MVNVGPRRPCYVDNSERAFLCAEDRVIHYRVFTGHFESDLDHRSPGRRHQSYSDAACRRICEIAFAIKFIKDGAHNVER